MRRASVAVCLLRLMPVVVALALTPILVPGSATVFPYLLIMAVLLGPACLPRSVLYPTARRQTVATRTIAGEGPRRGHPSRPPPHGVVFRCRTPTRRAFECEATVAAIWFPLGFDGPRENPNTLRNEPTAGVGGTPAIRAAAPTRTDAPISGRRRRLRLSGLYPVAIC